jgi:hypothetical protein
LNLIDGKISILVKFYYSHPENSENPENPENPDSDKLELKCVTSGGKVGKKKPCPPYPTIKYLKTRASVLVTHNNS